METLHYEIGCLGVMCLKDSDAKYLFLLVNLTVCWHCKIIKVVTGIEYLEISVHLSNRELQLTPTLLWGGWEGRQVSPASCHRSCLDK